MAEPEPDLVRIGSRLFTATTAQEWPEFIELIHPDAELELRSQPGRIIRGRGEMETFARSVIARRHAHEISVDIGPRLVRRTQRGGRRGCCG